MKKLAHITELFEQNNGILTTKELLDNGIYFYNIQQLLANETIIKLKQGLYKLNDSTIDEKIELTKLVPQGCICLLSAAFYYEFSTFIPSEYQIAIPRKSKVMLASYSPIQVFYWSENSYQLGQTTIETSQGIFKIYDQEKTVCDIFKYREKIGMDTVKEILKNYLICPNRNLAKLGEYAKKMRIDKALFYSLEILL